MNHCSEFSDTTWVLMNKFILFGKARLISFSFLSSSNDRVYLLLWLHVATLIMFQYLHYVHLSPLRYLSWQIWLYMDFLLWSGCEIMKKIAVPQNNWFSMNLAKIHPYYRIWLFQLKSKSVNCRGKYLLNGYYFGVFLYKTWSVNC